LKASGIAHRERKEQGNEQMFYRLTGPQPVASIGFG
jgi:hypothetical protein